MKVTNTKPRRNSNPTPGGNITDLVRDATAGALQALGVMTSFVIFGLGWALIAGANPYHDVPNGTRGPRPAHVANAESGCVSDSRSDSREDEAIALPDARALTRVFGPGRP